MFVFWKIWRALFSCNTHFEIRPSALLPKFCIIVVLVFNPFHSYHWFSDIFRGTEKDQWFLCLILVSQKNMFHLAIFHLQVLHSQKLVQPIFDFVIVLECIYIKCIKCVHLGQILLEYVELRKAIMFNEKGVKKKKKKKNSSQIVRVFFK